MYDKRQIFTDGATLPYTDPSDMYKQLLLLEFGHTMQKGPSQERFTFRTLHSKSEKKNSSYVEKKIFFLQKWIAFGETIPKRYNTWGPKSYIRILVGGGWVGVPVGMFLTS